MKNIVIAGDGPIGYLTAIRFRQLLDNLGRKDVKVTLVGPRVGPYKESNDPEIEGTDTRIGTVDPEIFRELEKDINPGLAERKTLTPEFPVKPTSSRHIKDTVRELYKAAKKIGIHLIRGKVTELTDQGCIVTSKDGKTPYDCEWLMDITGHYRAMANEANRLESKEPPFKIVQAVDEPIEDHFIAEVKMSNMDLVFAMNPIPAKNPIHPTLGLEKLRKMGWKHFDSPFIEIKPLEKNKACIYFEIPPVEIKAEVLKDDKFFDKFYKEYLTALLQLKSGLQNISFDRLPTESKRLKNLKKSRFNPFKLKPHKLVNAKGEFVAYYKPKKGPLVIFGGDTLMDPDYRLGRGILEGRKILQVLIDLIKEKKNFESVDLDDYQKKVTAILTQYEKEMIDYAEKRKAELDKAFEGAEERYTQVISSIAEGSDRDAMIATLDEIKSLEANNLFKQGSKMYKTAVEKGGLNLTRKHEVKASMQLLESRRLLETALRKVPNSNPPLAKNILAELLGLAKDFKELGAKLFAAGNFSLSEKYYQFSLDMYTKHFPNQHAEEVVKLSSNLCMLSNKKRAFDAAIKHATAGLAALETANLSAEEKDKFLGKFYGHKANGLLNKTMDDLSEKKHDVKKAEEACVEVANILTNLKQLKQPTVDIKNIEEKLAACEARTRTVAEKDKLNIRYV